MKAWFLRQQVQRVGIERVLHPLQALDQRRITEREADPQAGQRARLGQRLHDQQVVEVPHQGDGRFAAEVDVRLIHHDHAVSMARQQLTQRRQAQQQPGWRIGIGQDDAATVGGEGGGVDSQVRAHRHLADVDAAQFTPHRVETVGHIGKAQRPRVLEQAQEGEGQHLVGAVADEHLLRLQPVARGDGAAWAAK